MPYESDICPSSQQKEVTTEEGSRSQREDWDSDSTDVNTNAASVSADREEEGSQWNYSPRSVKTRKHSSTRYQFLDLSDNFLSVSCSDSSEMASDYDIRRCGECEDCTEGQVCTFPVSRASSSKTTVTEDNVMAKMLKTLDEQQKVLKKFNTLALEVNALKTAVNKQNEKIDLQDQVLNDFVELSEKRNGSDRSQRGKRSKKILKGAQGKVKDTDFIGSSDELIYWDDDPDPMTCGKLSSKLNKVEEEKIGFSGLQKSNLREWNL